MLVKYFLTSFSLLILMTCDKEAEITDCSAVLCLAQTFTIELVDTEGTDLIENGSYPLENILISKGVNTVNVPHDNQVTGKQFFLSGEEGKNSYTIDLNDAETDTLILDLNMVSAGSECCSPIFDILYATYNGSVIEIIKDNNVNKIVVIKPKS